MRRAAAIPTSIVLALAALTPGVLADQHEGSAEHPIVGTWVIESSPEDTANSLELGVFGAGGTMVNIGDGVTWAGSWEPTDEDSIVGTFHSLANDPEAGFGGLVTVRFSGDVSEDGQSFVGTFTVEIPAAVAEAIGAPAGQLGPGR